MPNEIFDTVPTRQGSGIQSGQDEILNYQKEEKALQEQLNDYIESAPDMLQNSFTIGSPVKPSLFSLP